MLVRCIRQHSSNPFQGLHCVHRPRTGWKLWMVGKLQPTLSRVQGFVNSPRTGWELAGERVVLEAQHAQRQRGIRARDLPGELVVVEQQHLGVGRHRRQGAREAVGAEVHVAQARRALERRQRASQAAAAFDLRQQEAWT